MISRTKIERIAEEGDQIKILCNCVSVHHHHHHQTEIINTAESKRMIRTVSYSSAGKNSEMFPADSGYLIRRILTLVLFSAAVSLPCLVLYHGAYHSSQSFVRTSENLVDSSSDTEEVRLERILRSAAMEDRTVILTTLNEAWATPDSIIDVFLESFLFGDQTRKLLNHLVIVALDQKAYARCVEVHLHCFALTTEGVDFSQEAYFMDPDYLKMMWRRIDFLRSVLEMGYNFIFTDADIMWFRSPFHRFYPGADFQIACDNFLSNSHDLRNRPNGGFNYVISNNRTIEFYKFWYSAREVHPGKHDQDVLNMIKYDPFIKHIGLKIRFLNTAYFGGLCEPSRNLSEVCTMHANCCYGLDSKLNDMRVMLRDWRKFMALPPPVKKSWRSSWSVPQNCSLKSYHPPALKKTRPALKKTTHHGRKDRQ